MAEQCVIMDLRNPKPAIEYEGVKGAEAPGWIREKVVAYLSGKGYLHPETGEHVGMANNHLAFPHVFRAVLSAGASLPHELRVAAAEAIAKYQQGQGLDEHHLLPGPTDLVAGKYVATQVYTTATTGGLVTRPPLETLEQMQARYAVLGTRQAEEQERLEYLLKE
ncbi:hypothetical protein COY95_04515 [Candidatus Woesearchaeota archaeon CG_4_10_14_0_8_um_filter_47_5]|nr:MAG: hypothetical protein COY95_04515 [Candidatus Woesearchaeota archaeon CG_4_10_14_0_8_um_filter_47_5]